MFVRKVGPSISILLVGLSRTSPTLAFLSLFVCQARLERGALGGTKVKMGYPERRTESRDGGCVARASYTKSIIIVR
ncbi:hypothetical protein QBC43DRAFT_102153 [Cladorrhinum sp. PSN259]|nr:hypothetical protein QBC43DRAFT_102153 [Cladorrhinum sp. PSN259]